MKRILNRIGNRLLQILFSCSFNDLTNAFKAYRKEKLFDIQPLESEGFDITIEISLGMVQKGFHIKQVAVNWKERSAGASKMKLFKACRLYLARAIELRFKRETFPGML